jgi:hypothetical protein
MFYFLITLRYVWGKEPDTDLAVDTFDPEQGETGVEKSVEFLHPHSKKA